MAIASSSLRAFECRRSRSLHGSVFFPRRRLGIGQVDQIVMLDGRGIAATVSCWCSGHALARCLLLCSQFNGLRSRGSTRSTQFTRIMNASDEGELVSAKARRVGSLLAASTACLLLLAPGAPASADNADPVGGPGQATIAVEADGPAGPDHLIMCDINATKPRYSGTTITAVGYMSSCTPSSPEACRTETGLLRYYPGPGTWEVVASGGVN